MKAGFPAPNAGRINHPSPWAMVPQGFPWGHTDWMCALTHPAPHVQSVDADFEPSSLSNRGTVGENCVHPTTGLAFIRRRAGRNRPASLRPYCPQPDCTRWHESPRSLRSMSMLRRSDYAGLSPIRKSLLGSQASTALQCAICRSIHLARGSTPADTAESKPQTECVCVLSSQEPPVNPIGQPANVTGPNSETKTLRLEVISDSPGVSS